MTPQQLMDLPYHGDAERQLKSEGKWKYSKEEVLNQVYEGIDTAMNTIQNELSDMEWALSK